MKYDECYSTLPVFLEETSELIKKNIGNATSSMWREKIYNESFSPSIDLNIPMDGIKQLTNIISSMELDTKNILERFKNLSDVDTEKISNLKGIKVKWRSVNELGNIRLQYFDSFVKKVQDACEDIITNKVIDKNLQYFRDSSRLTTLKSNLVVTCVPYYMTNKDLLTVQNEEIYAVTPETVNNIFRGFLLEFYNIRLKSKSGDKYKEMSFSSITGSICKKINDTVQRLGMLESSTINVTDASLHPSIKKMFYSVDMIVLQTVQYLFAVYMRTLTSYINNVRELMRVQNLMDTNYGDVASVMTESVVSIMDTCTLEKPAKLITAVSNLMTAMKNTNLVTKSVAEMKEIGSDPYTYQFPIRTMKDLNGRLKKLIIDNHRDDMDTASSDLIADAKLSQDDLKGLFSNTDRAENMNFLKTVENDPNFIYLDLCLMLNNLPIISDTINHMKTNIIGKYIQALEANVNNAFPNGLRNKDIIEFLQDLLENISWYERELAKAYVRRLRMIGNILKIESSSEISLELDNYFADAIASSYRVILEEDESLEEMNREYQKLLIRNTVGMFFEDDNNKDQNTDNGNSGNNNQQNNNQKDAGSNNQNNNNNPQNQQNSNDDNPSKKPVITDNGNQNDSKDTNNDGNNDTSKKSKFGVQKIKDFINNIIESMKNWMESSQGKKNKNILESNKDYLLNRSYVNSTIELLPIRQNFQPIGMLDQMIKNVSSITKDTLKTADEKTMIQKVFNNFGLPNNIEDVSTLDNALLQSVKFGNSNPDETKKLSNNAIKEIMPGVISFLEMYYGGDYISKLQKFEETSVDKLNTFFQLAKFVNNGDNNDRTLDNLQLTTNLIHSGIKGVRGASREVAQYYMDIVAGFAKSNPDNKK